MPNPQSEHINPQEAIDNEHFDNLTQIAQSVLYASMQYYRHNGFRWVDVPQIVGVTGACENVDTLFQVNSRQELPLFFTQTGQLALEQALQTNHAVYTVIHSGRDEELEDTRHLRQFRLTEEEFDSTTIGIMDRAAYDEEEMYQALLTHIESSTKAMIAGVLQNNSDLLTSYYKRDTAALEAILDKPYLRIDYATAIHILSRLGFPLSFGDDITTPHEAEIVRVVNQESGNGPDISAWSPLLIMRYPKDIKFFNMKVSRDDPRVVLSADCVFPYSGESTGAAVREHDGEKLVDRLKSSTMFRLHQQRGGSLKDFEWYLDIILSHKTLPHAGFGIGNERVIQFILGSDDIRNCSVMSLLARQTGDWDR